MLEFLPAIGSAITSLIGLFKPGSGGGKDTEYINAVNQSRQEEYSLTQQALQKVTVPAAQQQIIQIYNQEQSLWGDPNNPNRNVAQPAQFKVNLQNIVDTYGNQNTINAVPSATTNTATQAAGSQAAADTSGALANFINQLNSALPLITNTGTQKQDYSQYIPIAVIGVILVVIIMKGK